MNKDKVNVWKDFFNISHWETFLILFFAIATLVGMWYVIKKYKIKFQYRVLMGLGLGLIFGIAIAGGGGFPKGNVFEKDRWGNYEYAYEANQWFGLISSLFISGLMIMILPVVFLAMARIVSKRTKSNIAGITWKGIAILLINVAVAFTITFWLGIIMNIGNGFEITKDDVPDDEPLKSLSGILKGYMPNNFFSNMGKVVIIPVLLLGIIIGLAIRKLTKRNEEMMDKSRDALERYWKICMSVLMFFVKFMPYAVFTMISTAIFKRPIGEFASIGELIGLGYLCLFISYGWHVFTVWLFGISPTKFIKRGFKPVSSGFLTQSSMATLPLAMETLKEDMKLEGKSASPDIVMPLSTTIGLTGCAGVQSGVILTLLNNAAGSPVDMNLGVYFILGLIITMFVSLGIAGIPGTATIVTIGVVSTIGFPGFVNPVINVISPLNGIFDMGRTGVNVNGGLQASLITASIEDELPDDMKTVGPLTPLLNKYHKWRARKKQ